MAGNDVYMYKGSANLFPAVATWHSDASLPKRVVENTTPLHTDETVAARRPPTKRWKYRWQILGSWILLDHDQQPVGTLVK